MIPAEVRTFQDLIMWLAATHHGGHYYPMARDLKTAIGTVYLWKDGMTKRPSDAILAKLCARYGLDENEVFLIAAGRRPLPQRRRAIAGGSDAVAVAAATTITRGSAPRGRTVSTRKDAPYQYLDCPDASTRRRPTIPALVLATLRWGRVELYHNAARTSPRLLACA